MANNYPPDLWAAERAKKNIAKKTVGFAFIVIDDIILHCWYCIYGH